MARLIDADAYKHILKGWLSETYSDRYDSQDREGAAIFCCICQLDDAPTVDAVPVVRCRDCKYWGDEAGVTVRADGVRFARCKVHNLCVSDRKIGWCPTEDDFCSLGERRMGDD